MAKIDWYSPEDSGRWSSLRRADLTRAAGDGIYMIWHKGKPSRVISVGQGPLARRIAVERLDPGILFYERFGTLQVAWAVVPRRHRDGMERFLADTWKPLVGSRVIKARPIPVNAPWETEVPGGGSRWSGLGLFRSFA